MPFLLSSSSQKPVPRKPKNYFTLRLQQKAVASIFHSHIFFQRWPWYSSLTAVSPSCPLFATLSHTVQKKGHFVTPKASETVPCTSTAFSRNTHSSNPAAILKESLKDPKQNTWRDLRWVFWWVAPLGTQQNLALCEWRHIQMILATESTLNFKSAQLKTQASCTRDTVSCCVIAKLPTYTESVSTIRWLCLPFGSGLLARTGPWNTS